MPASRAERGVRREPTAAPLRHAAGQRKLPPMGVRKVGTSRILREIGRGGMSVVYEGYQDGLDRRVAVKALDTGGVLPKELAERFRREGRAYAQLSHSAIVAVHDLVEKDEALYLVTEFVDGPDLRRVLAGGAIHPACVAALGTRLADALECVHTHALVHRDVKPANVMDTRRGEVKLMDLGVAKDPIATDLTRTGAVVGTPAYVAPEVLEGEQAAEPSDLWALGVTLYELATGARPFFGDSFPALFTAVRKKPFRPIREIVPGFPRRLAHAVERCLEKRPARRWESAGALARELEACTQDLLGDTRPEEALAALVLERAGGPAREDGAAPAAEVAYAALARRPRGASGPRKLTWALVTALGALAAVGSWYILSGRF
jgi:serine/threonine-protein kinase